MQTFLPLPSFRLSLKILDYRRLGKQRVEAAQILASLNRGSGGWSNHPAAVMWRGHMNALMLYHDDAIREWTSRGYNNTMPLFGVGRRVRMPWWFGHEPFHASHRSNLLRKASDYYGELGWKEPHDLPYFWPSKETQV